MVTGRCDCGKVRFTVEAEPDTATVCHCSQCRRTSGHLWASTLVPSWDVIQFDEAASLQWYASSDFAERGFCNCCGSSLFYRMKEHPQVAIAAGCLEAPNMRISKHIFVKDKASYYEITDDLPQIERW